MKVLQWLTLLPLCVGAFMPCRLPGTSCPAQAHRRAISRLFRPPGVHSVRAVAVDAYDRSAWEAGYDSALREIEATRLPCTTGTLPNDLVGTYFRNGTSGCDHLASLKKIASSTYPNILYVSYPIAPMAIHAIGMYIIRYRYHRARLQRMIYHSCIVQ